MAKLKHIVLIGLLFLCYFAVYSQTISGLVLDQATSQPIESAAIYFDNTTIGTSTNDKGEFSIEYQEGVTSPLVISFLGYKRMIITNYQVGKLYKVLLQEDIDALDEVVITTDDGMPKELKLQQFRQQFLGFSNNAKSCTILNEEDLILRYNKKTQTLSASSKKPILIKNEKLQYLVSFEIKDFDISYHHINIKRDRFFINSVIYTGTSFYKELEESNSKKTTKSRNKAYKGSVLHFMRALSKKQLEEEGCQIFSGGFKVNPYRYINVKQIDSSKAVGVKLLNKLSILYDNEQSAIESRVDEFIIDQYGNHSPIHQVLFGGHMGNQRIGDSLPFDFMLSE